MRKIDIVPDHRAGVMRAFLVEPEGFKREVSTLGIGVIEQFPGAYSTWKKMLRTDILSALMFRESHEP